MKVFIGPKLGVETIGNIKETKMAEKRVACGLPTIQDHEERIGKLEDVVDELKRATAKLGEKAPKEKPVEKVNVTRTKRKGPM